MGLQSAMCALGRGHHRAPKGVSPRPQPLLLYLCGNSAALAGTEFPNLLPLTCFPFQAVDSVDAGQVLEPCL